MDLGSTTSSPLTRQMADLQALSSPTLSPTLAVSLSNTAEALPSQTPIFKQLLCQLLAPQPHPSLPYDPYGLYYVLTSRDVIESSGFCTQFCGWHSYTTGAAGNIKFSFVGDSSQCPSACSAQTISPNSNLGADAMISVIAHELWEAQTNPLFNAWYDTAGYENADKCAWTFGATSQLSSGASYNVRLGGLPYLIQQNWDAKNGRCRLTYP
jgi:hypothetical protein